MTFRALNVAGILRNSCKHSIFYLQVRASNKLGFGPFSDPLTTQTMKLDTTPSARKDAPDETLTIVVAVLVGAVCVIVAIVAILFWRRLVAVIVCNLWCHEVFHGLQLDKKRYIFTYYNHFSTYKTPLKDARNRLLYV